MKAVGENSSLAVFYIKGENILGVLEKEIENVLYRLIELEVEEEIMEIGSL